MLEAKCWHDLHDPQVGGQLDIEDFYELAKAAGLSQKEVEALVEERAYQRMRKEMPP